MKKSSHIAKTAKKENLKIFKIQFKKNIKGICVKLVSNRMNRKQ